MGGRIAMSKRWWMIIGAVVIVGLGLGGWQVVAGRQEGSTHAQDGAETAVVQRGTLVDGVEGAGNLRPASEIELAFLAGGRVVEILVQEEQAVAPGQPLARLETDELTWQVARARAALASAEGQLAQLAAPPRPEEVAAPEANLAAAQGQVNAAIANRDQVTAGPDAAEIAAAEAQVAQAEMSHRSAVHAYDAADEGDEDRKEQARYDLWAAEVALEAAKTQLDVLRQGTTAEEVRAAQAEVARAVAQRDVAQAQLDLLLAGAGEERILAAEAAVAQARAGLAQAELALVRATLTARADAPVSNTVTSLDVSRGEMVAPGQPVLVLSDLSGLEVEIYLDEADVARVAIGMEAQVRLDALPDVELRGEVTHIAPVGSVASGVVFYPVTVRLARSSLPVRAGMTADVEIIIACREDALLVPLRAVHTEGERVYVEVERVVGNRVEEVDVILGMMTDTEAEITAGLDEGDVVRVVPRAESGAGRGMFGPFGGGN